MDMPDKFKEEQEQYKNHLEYKVALRTEKLEKELYEGRKREERLLESEQRLKNAERLATLGHWSFDLEENVLYWSDETYQIFEVDASRFDGSFETFLDFVHPDDRHLLYKTYKESLRDGQAYGLDHRIVLDDGRIKYVHQEWETYYDELGHALRSLGTVQDITERRQSEKKIEHLNRVLRSMRNVHQLIIKEKDPKQLIDGICRNLIENRGYNSVWIMLVDDQWRPVEFTGAGIGQRFHFLRKMYQEGELPQCALNSLNKPGVRVIDKIPECANCPSFQNDSGEKLLDLSVRLEYEGKIYGILHAHLPDDFALIKEEQELFSEVAEDISYALYNVEIEEERKKFKYELIQAKEKAEESDRLKSAFLANINHEIRTPLSGIVGPAQLLKQNTLSQKEQAEYGKMIEDSGHRIMNLFDDLMNISRIETGQISISTGKTNINRIIENLYSFYEPRYREKGIDFSYRVALSGEESAMITDENKVNQVLSNLLNNALKFTDSGSVHFGYTLESNKFKFFVRDTGKGLHPDNQEKVFQRFVQEDTHPYSHYEGVGLGLTISKSIVEALGGTMWVDSQTGEGSTFYFTLP